MQFFNKQMIIMFLILISISSVYASIVPYNGLTLQWKGSFELTNFDDPSANFEEKVESIFFYNKTDGDLIQRKELKDDIEESVNIITREIVTGEDKGKHTSHWIPTNVKVGDKIEVVGTEFIVDSLSDTIFLSDFGQIDAIKITYKKSIKYYTSSGWHFKDNVDEEEMWYDPSSGLNLKEIMTSSYVQGVGNIDYWRKVERKEYELKENNVDTDKDGLTDLKELLQFSTNPKSSDTDFDGLLDKEEISLGTSPLLKDTDGDLWNDKVDIQKLNFSIPNGIFFLVAVIISSYFLYRKMTKEKVIRKHKRDEETWKPVSLTIIFTLSGFANLFWSFTLLSLTYITKSLFPSFSEQVISQLGVFLGIVTALSFIFGIIFIGIAWGFYKRKHWATSWGYGISFLNILGSLTFIIFDIFSVGQMIIPIIIWIFTLYLVHSSRKEMVN